MDSRHHNTKQYNEIAEELEQVTRCLVCGSESQKPIFIGQDDRYGYPDKFPVVECMNCGLAYLAVRPHPDSVAALYQKYYDCDIKGMDCDLSTNLKTKIKNSPLKKIYYFLINPRENLYRSIYVRSNMRVLDIGSGPAMDNARQIQQQGGEWQAVDVDQAVCQLIKSAGFSANCGTLEEFSRTKPEAFDYIILSQILEHVYEPAKFLRDASCLLRLGGRLVLSCPNYESFLRQQYETRWIHWHIPYHVAHYNYNTLKLLSESAGLDLTKFYTISPITWYFAQQQMAKGLAYSYLWHGKVSIRLQQRLLDFRLSRKHKLNQGDALVAHLKLSS